MTRAGLTAHAHHTRGTRNDESSWALVHDHCDSNCDWVLQVVEKISEDEAIVRLQKHSGTDIGRYLTTHGGALKGYRDENSDFVLVDSHRDSDSLWRLLVKGESTIQLIKEENNDENRYLSSHGGAVYKRDGGSSWAIVHVYAYEEKKASEWELQVIEPINIKTEIPEGADAFMILEKKQQCPTGLEILNEDTCREAHRRLKLKADRPWSDVYPGIPKGCSHRKNSGHNLHFNKARTGGSRADMQPVCFRPGIMQE